MGRRRQERVLCSLIACRGAIDIGTVGLVAASPTPARTAVVIIVNDASDPTSTLPPSNCIATPEGGSTQHDHLNGPIIAATGF